MPVYQTVLIYAGIPLLIILFFAALTLPGGRRRPRWRSGQQWEHEPVWYEPHHAAAAHAGPGDAHGLAGGDGHAALGAGATRPALPSGEQLESRAAAAGPLGGARGTW